jgi:hypothetical protein
MASFTDKISQFNPYIQELPVQEMVQVGMYKQAKYDQGVQKIQNYIDRISGLDISKPGHKQYLQSKLGELGNNLKTVAAGDFSNQQLVNSVVGMTGQIVKDPIVQNAIYSTQLIKRGYSEIEAARKAGKSGKDNEDYYQSIVNDWMANPDLKASFSGRYTPYKDVNKKLIELADNLKKDPSSTNIDNPFVRNDKGETLYFRSVKDPKTGRQVEVASIDPSQGEKKLDLDMIRIKVKGTPAEKIYNTFVDSLDGNDIEQLRINSWARYKGADVKTFQNDIIDTYTTRKEMLSQQIVDISAMLQNPNLTSAQKAEGKVVLDNLTKKYNDGSIDKEMNQELANLNKNIETSGLDNFKYKLYKDNYLTRLAKDLSNRTFEEERLDNPAFKANMDREEFQFNQLKFQDESARGWANIKTIRDRLDWEKQVKAMELTGTSLTDVSEGAVGTGKPLPTVVSEQKALENALLDKAKLRSNWAKSLFPEIKDKAQLGDAFAKLEYDYRTNPQINLNAKQKAYLTQATTLDNDISSKINAINSAIRVGAEKALQNTIGKITDDAVLVTDSGNKFKTSEITDVLAKLDQFRQPGGFKPSQFPTGISTGTYVGETLDTKGATAFFKGYQGGKYADLVAPYIKKEAGYKSFTSNEQKIIDKFGSVSKIYNNELGKIPQYESEHLSKISPTSISQKATLSPDLVKADELVLDRFLSKASDRLGDQSATTVSGWWNSRKSADADKGGKVNWVFEKFRDGSAQIIAKKGARREIIPVLPEDMANYFPQAQVSNPFNSIRDYIYNSPSKTTNLAGKTDDNPYNAVNAKFTGYDLPQLAGSTNAGLFRFDIEGSPDNTGKAETDKYLFVGYVKDPKTDIWKRQEMSNGYEIEEKMLTIMKKLNTGSIAEAIKNWK